MPYHIQAGIHQRCSLLAGHSALTPPLPGRDTAADLKQATAITEECLANSANIAGRGRRRPDDAQRGVQRVIAAGEDQRSTGPEDRRPGRRTRIRSGRRPWRWRCPPVPGSSQITTVEAPISIRNRWLNPASATDRAKTAATASTAVPATFHAQRDVLQGEARAQQGPERQPWRRAGVTVSRPVVQSGGLVAWMTLWRR